MAVIVVLRVSLNARECVVSDVCNWPDRFEFGAHRHITLHEIHHAPISK